MLQAASRGLVRRRTPPTNGGGACVSSGMYDRELWHVKRVKTKHCTLTELATGTKYNVPAGRTNKALASLHVDSLLECLAGSSCTCGATIPCTAALGQHLLTEVRTAYFQCATEVAATEFLRIHLLHTNHTTSPGCRIKYAIRGHNMCRSGFMAVFQLSNNKLAAVKEALVNGAVRARLPGMPLARGGLSGRPANMLATDRRTQGEICQAFWGDFFETHCSHPNDHTRVFPGMLTRHFIYVAHFQPWWKKTVLAANPDAELPSLATFKKARWCKPFTDVKEIRKHHHCKCPTCFELNNARMLAWTDGVLRVDFEERVDLHRIDVYGYRTYEGTELLRAMHRPGHSLVFSYDDTVDAAFPHLTVRPPKNLTHHRVKVIPFAITNHSDGQHHYIYTTKGRYSKGANRLCTTLYHAIRRVKNGTHECRHARRLVLIGDNYSENKNSTMFAWASHLVMEGWFDTVEFAFGPVGHTHNGRDACHHVHNNLVGVHNCATLTDYVLGYNYAWHSERTRPGAVLLDVQYDWKTWYTPVEDKLAGFHRTKTNPNSIRAFRISLGRSNIVHLQWKLAPQDPQWLGADGLPDSPGFVCLKARPVGPLPVVPPNGAAMPKDEIQQLTGRKMLDVLKSIGMADSMEWLREAATTGRIPRGAAVNPDEPTPPGDWGRTYTMGVGDRTAPMQIIEDLQFTTVADVFRLPQNLQDELEEQRRRIAQVRTAARFAPPIGYARVPVQQRLTNANRRARPEDSHAAVMNVHGADQSDGDYNEEESDAAAAAVGQPAEPVRRVNPPRNARPEESLAQPGQAPTDGDDDDEDSEYVESDEDSDAWMHAHSRASVRLAAANTAAVYDPADAEVTWGALWSMCKVNHYAVIQGSWADGAQQGIDIGKIIAVHQPDKTFQVKLLTCARNRWTPAAITAVWHHRSGNTADGTYHDYNAIAYTEKLNGKGASRTLPVAIRRTLEEHQDTLFSG